MKFKQCRTIQIQRYIIRIFWLYLDLVFSSSLLDHMPSFSANSLEEDEEDTLPLTGNASFGLFGLNINLVGPRYQCHSCEQPDCSEPSICHDAFQVINPQIIFKYWLHMLVTFV